MESVFQTPSVSFIPQQFEDVLQSYKAGPEFDHGLWESICAIDLSRVQKKVELEEKWLEHTSKAAVEGYRLFLYLLSKNRGVPISPYKFVDEVWHTHVLESVRKYQSDCMKSLGFMPDHSFNLPGDVARNSVFMGDILPGHFNKAVFGQAGCDGHSSCEGDTCSANCDGD
jgi:hypothetical protein